VSESAEALAEKVRGCLNDRDGMTFNGARRALDTLLARLAEAEKERDRLDVEFDNGCAAVRDEPVCTKCGTNHDRDESAMCEGGEVVTFGELPAFLLARLAEAEKERDKWKALYGEIGARLARYGDALERLRLAVNGIIPALDKNEVVNERDRAYLLNAYLDSERP
jgi:hypothetical protein